MVQEYDLEYDHTKTQCHGSGALCMYTAILPRPAAGPLGINCWASGSIRTAVSINAAGCRPKNPPSNYIFNRRSLDYIQNAAGEGKKGNTKSMRMYTVMKAAQPKTVAFKNRFFCAPLYSRGRPFYNRKEWCFKVVS
jgi:hypothetical protein